MPSLNELDALLAELATPASGHLVLRLPRQPGQKEARWRQQLAEEAPAPETASAPLSAVVSLPPEAEQRLAQLELEVASLRSELERLRRALGGE
jgi:hypothetical protein